MAALRSTMRTDKTFREFFTSYVETALWSSTDNADDSGGEPLDKNYGADDIAPEALESMRADCERFLSEQAETLAAATCARSSGSTQAEMAGHDFWLNRNGHGAGFWDGDWSDPHGDTLSDACKAFGTVDLYVGDDGRIYQ